MKKIFFIVVLFNFSFNFVNAEAGQIFGPSALYKEEPYTFVLDRNGNLQNSDSKIKVYVYNPKLEIAFTDEQNVDQLSSASFYFNIPANTLSTGEYFMSVEAIDNVGKSRIVAQKDIGVLSGGKTWIARNSEILFATFGFITVVAFIHHVAKERELYAILNKLQISKKRKTRTKTKKSIKKTSK